MAFVVGNWNDGQPSTLTHAFKEDPTNLTATLKTMLWVFLGLNIIAIFSDVAQINLLKSVNIAMAKAEVNDTRQQVIGIICLIAFVVTGVTFLKWIYRANLNVRGFGARELKFTPGWSIGYYFIPILNFFKPYQAMKEIWKTSKNPANWENEQGSPLLVWWWTLWLFSILFGKFTFRGVMRADTITKLSEATIVTIIDSFIWIVLTAVAISLVSRIFEMQRDFVYYYKQVESEKVAEQADVRHTQLPAKKSAEPSKKVGTKHLTKESDANIQCPQCGKWGVKKLNFDDSTYGYYCYNCNQSLKTMPSFIDGGSTPSTAKTIPDALAMFLGLLFFIIGLMIIGFIENILEHLK